MKETLYNYDNLTNDDITEVSIRVKALIINDGKILIGNESGCYQFVGGHLEDGETLIEALKREVREEAGIILNDNEIVGPFYKVTFMNRDYNIVGNNRRSEIYYYAVYTSKLPDISKTNYTEHEKESHYEVIALELDKAIDKIRENIPNHVKNEGIAPDMIGAIEVYLEELGKRKK